ncbi:hypothetical protein OAP63_00735 [Vibrio sp.]|nr:hypothetical protein [Vibrio sp.]
MRLISFLIALIFLVGVWYWYFLDGTDSGLKKFDGDQQVIDILSSDISKRDLLSVIAYFEANIERTKTHPRLYSYYASALSMKAIFQVSPLDKQASSSYASSIFANVAEIYPNQALSVLFEAITLLKSPDFLKLNDKSFSRLKSSLDIIQSDAEDGSLDKLNKEALVILIKFIPVFKDIYIERGRSDLSVEKIENSALEILEEVS